MVIFEGWSIKCEVGWTGSFFGARHVLNLDLCGEYASTFIYKTSLSCTLRICVLKYKLYVIKKVNKRKNVGCLSMLNICFNHSNDKKKRSSVNTVLLLAII